jgi:uncharacterized membrane protein YcaP (DUF421 family)
MWQLAQPWWEFVVRAAIVYFFLIVLLRVTGKRQVGQLAPFDLVLLLVLSTSVQNSIIGNDASLPGGLLSAGTLVGLNYAMGVLTFKNRKVEELIEGRPQILIHDGKLSEDVMASARLTHHELHAALRRAGCARVEEVKLAMLENNGAISVMLRKDGA